ncbi:nucleoside recognition domain-containing protein [Cytobacillus sp. Hz8]|uniref:nucleoside recognition domain-containing protein n=1 Tax=Cytobacillus sp. Hz8 TaxID=3347168 RepID=UPI0035D75DEE
MQLLEHFQDYVDESTKDEIVQQIYLTSKNICDASIKIEDENRLDQTQKLDAIFTSKWLGLPIMLIMLAVVFYITIAGANIPSSWLTNGFNYLEKYLSEGLTAIHAPNWVNGVLILGLYRGIAWVVSVMLPPMAIFFPIFGLLENYGYLPRVAFNLDRIFKKVGAHGKQSLTMAMGFGCNAAAIISTRIIESPRERMLAILTNNFVPCNGRWPTLILISTLFMAAGFTTGAKPLVTTLMLVGMVLIGIITTLLVSFLLSKTMLKGVPTHYTLELPPFRRPKFWDTIVRVSIERSASVLKRAIVIAAPAGVLIWVIANISIGDMSLLTYLVDFLNPFAKSLGLDGYILLAFILGLPANEIVIPILLMGYLSTGALTELDDLTQIKHIFIDHGWTWLTALNMMLFSLLHYPCGTTLFNIYKETKSVKWTLVAFLIPTAIAVGVTFTVTQVVHLFQ